MKIKPINFADFDSVELKKVNNRLTPHCIKHGAMNKMNILEDGGGYWRCITVVSNHTDNVCRSGCCEVREN